MTEEGIIISSNDEHSLKVPSKIEVIEEEITICVNEHISKACGPI